MSFDLLDFRPLFLVIAGAGLCLSLCMEQSQIVAKTRGAFAGKIATGYMSAMRIMIINRVGTILYMFFFSLCIDVGITNRALLMAAAFSALGILAYNVVLIVQRLRVLAFSAALEDNRLKELLFAKDHYYLAASFFATLANVLGLTLPFLLSNSFPEYRLTMANTGFLLNVIFTLINVMILETRYAYLLDHGSNAATYAFVVKIFAARSVAAVTAITIFVSLWVWI